MLVTVSCLLLAPTVFASSDACCPSLHDELDALREQVAELVAARAADREEMLKLRTTVAMMSGSEQAVR